MQAKTKENGFMLVMALAIMAILILVGVSGSFLSVANSRDSKNILQTAVVRYQAEAGLDAALLKLSKDYANWPTWCTSAPCTVPNVSGLSYSVVLCPLNPGCTTPYNPANNPSATPTVTNPTPAVVPLIVRSTSSFNGTEYVAEAVISKNTSDLSDPIFGYGLVTKSSVSIPSNSVVQTNVWSGGSVTANTGTYFKTIPPGSTQNNGEQYWGRAVGSCQVHDEAVPFSTSKPAASTTNACLAGPTPPIPVPDFATLRALLMSEAGVTQTGSSYSGCTANASGASANVTSLGLTAATLNDSSVKKVICLAAGTTFSVPSGTFLKNTFIIGDTTTSVNIDGGTGPSVSGEANNRLGMKVASNAISFSQCNQASCTNDILTGLNTFVARANVSYQKAASTPDNVTRTLVVSAGDASNLASFPGNTTISGVSGQSVNASFWSRGTATLNGGGGSLEFTGTVVANSTLDFNGAAKTVQRPNGIDNNNFPPDPSAKTLVLISRK